MFISRSSTLNRLRRVRRSAWTLVEMMVALACAGILLAAFVAITLSVASTMVSVGNYNDLNKGSRQTLDQLSRDVRNASSVSSASTTNFLQLTNTYPYYGASYVGTNVITYSWDGSQVTRTWVTNGVTAGGVTTLLTNCDSFSLSYYQRNPTNNFGFVPTTTPSQIKLVSVSWRCSRTVLGSKLNTESVQTASVVVRN